MIKENHRTVHIVCGALVMAWLGVWGAWFPHQAAALRLNPIDLAEWTTFLRREEIQVMPDLLRLSVVLAMIALSISAGSIRNMWPRWGSRGLAIIPSLLILPPYPFVLQAWWSDSYGLRFTVASLGIVGIAAAILLDRLPHQRQIISALLSITSATLAIWAFSMLRIPFAERYAEAIVPGWGFVLFVVALLISVIFSAIDIAQSQTREQVELASEPEKKTGQASDPCTLTDFSIVAFYFIFESR